MDDMFEKSLEFFGKGCSLVMIMIIWPFLLAITLIILITDSDRSYF